MQKFFWVFFWVLLGFVGIGDLECKRTGFGTERLMSTQSAGGLRIERMWLWEGIGRDFWDIEGLLNVFGRRMVKKFG